MMMEGLWTLFQDHNQSILDHHHDDDIPHHHHALSLVLIHQLVPTQSYPTINKMVIVQHGIK